jgi:hypothetical protein
LAFVISDDQSEFGSLASRKFPEEVVNRWGLATGSQEGRCRPELLANRNDLLADQDAKQPNQSYERRSW